MVDINLIGDDKLGEEKSSEQERVDEFTQTSSMDTQELAFEERTETFDTTKTAGLTQKRNYSSLISTLIIISVIILLGWAIYYFMFQSTDTANQTELPQFIPESETVDEDFSEDIEPLTDQTSDESSGMETERQTEDFVQRPSTTDVQTVSPLPEVVSENVSTVEAQIMANSNLALQTVTNILTSMPSSLNTTLLSYAGQRLRFEFVSASNQQANDFKQRLSQYFGTGNFTVLSENTIAGNGQGLEKVLISATVSGADQSASSAFIDFLSLDQLSERIRGVAARAGLQVRQLQSQQGRLSNGLIKNPVAIRIGGSKAGFVNFLNEIESQSINVEITKILIVSQDMVSFSDDNLVLVINLYVYQPS